MPAKQRNIIFMLQRRERGYSAYLTSSIELAKFSEERAALSEMQEIHCKLPNSVRSTFLTSFSPDSTKVASTHGDHKIYVCDVKTGKLLHKLEGHPRTPWCLAFHPTSNDILASGCLGGEVRVWHLHGGSEKWRAYHSTVITSLAFHPLDKVLVIATFNEIHFWDWSLPEPFASCSTGTNVEKVRFVKFDQLGNKLITGISNLHEGIHRPPTASELAARSVPPRSTTPSEQLPGPSTLSHRRSLLNRLMSMYQHIEGLDELSRFTDGMERLPSPTQEEALNQARNYAEAATSEANRLQPPVHDRYWPDVPLDRIINPTMQSTSDGAGTSESRESLDTHEEFLVRAFWRTFYRLRSICTTLERRMIHLQRNAAPVPNLADPRPSTPTPSDRNTAFIEPVIERIRNATNDVASNTRASYRQVTSNYLTNVLTRLQNSLQFSFFSPLTNAVAQEQIQQLQTRISEILDRLTNVTGYRARLTTLRDQIFEVAERTERRGGDTFSIRQLDLAHCLWLVEMSLQLTQQMQRILHADYRLTLLHINSSRRSTPRNWPDNPGPSNSRPARNCACGNQGPADAGSTEEFDQAWDRLRVVVRRELETLTERFRSNLYEDVRQTTLRMRENALRNPRPASSGPDPLLAMPSLSSSSWQSLVPLPEYPSTSRRGAIPTIPHDRRTSDESDDEPPIRMSRHETLDRNGRRDASMFNYYRPWQRVHRRGLFNTTRNSRPTSAPSGSQSSSGQSSSHFFVPEIHIVPSSSAEDSEPSIIMPAHERPRSPPLPTILSGSNQNDPLLNSWFQTLYESGPRIRFATETITGFMHRIQCWDFSRYDIPSINNAKANLVVRQCKIHNDASVDISKDGELLVALLPSSSSITWDALLFAVFSLKPQSLGQVLLVSNFDSNAISVSFSPLSQYIVVGLASPRLYHPANEKQAVAQIFELKFNGKTLSSSHVRSLTQDNVSGMSNQAVSLNSVQWLPEPGQGLIYGTNRGCLCICKPVSPMNNKASIILKNNSSRYDPHLNARNRHYNHLAHLRMYSAATQTYEPEMQTTGTQTFVVDSNATSR